MDLALNGKTVWITGASGGIGSQIARQFAAEGARVGVHYHRNRESADSLVNELGPDRALAIGGDAADEDAMRTALDQLIDRFDRPEILVACAGDWPSEYQPVAEMDLARWRQTLENNLTSVFVTSREFLRRYQGESMVSPSLVLVGSTAGVFGEAGHADYAAAKSGLLGGLMLSLKNEVARLTPRGRVNTVSPGWTLTPMADKFSGDPQAVRNALTTIALRKVAVAKDIANAVLFLSSPSVAGHITGQNLTVSGGMEGRMLYEPAEVDPGKAIPVDR